HIAGKDQENRAEHQRAGLGRRLPGARLLLGRKRVAGQGFAAAETGCAQNMGWRSPGFIGLRKGF
ncbi:MAG: hypothetical protein ACK4MS_16300, partial [Paracoccaceae bacterium]